MKKLCNSSIKTFFILFLGLFCLKLNATHARAFEIYYECISNNSYTFFVKFYRDCDGINAPSKLSLNFYSPSGGSKFNIILPKISGPVDVSQLCPSQKPFNQCNGKSNPYPGTQEYIYSSVVNLPLQASDWLISSESCCRNNAITNIQNGGSYQIYIETTLDNTNNQCNNSPKYSNLPILYGCVGKPLYFNHGATDPDADSLSFELITPMGSNAIPMPFKTGLSLNNPVLSSNIFQFDPLVGQISFIPSSVQQGVLSIKTYEWKKSNGVYVKVGHTTREVQLIIIANCGSGSPKDSLVVNSGNMIDSVTIGVCEGETIDFDMIVTDSSPMFNYLISSNIGLAIPGANVSVTGTNPAIMHFNWTTGSNSVGQYIISMTVDNTDCPVPQILYKALAIQVYKKIEINIPDTSLCDSSILLDATLPGSTYLWSTGDTSSVITADSSGLYFVDIISGCSVRDSVQVSFYETPKANFTINTKCQLDTSLFLDLSSNASNHWLWDFGDGNTSVSQDPKHVYMNPGSYQIKLISSNSMVCQDTIKKNIIIDAPLNVNIGPDTNQCGGSIVLDGFSGPNINYLWSDSTTGPILNVSNSDTFWLELEHNGCIERDSVSVNIFPLPVADFLYQDGCLDSAMVFNDLSFSDIKSWDWDFGDGTGDIISSPSKVYTTHGVFQVDLEVADSNGCVDNKTVNVTIDTTIIPASTYITLCYNEFDYYMMDALADNIDTTGNWVDINGDTISDYFQVLNSDTSVFSYHVESTNACPSVLSNLYLSQALEIRYNVSDDDTLMIGESAKLYCDNGMNWNWSPSYILDCDDCSDPIASPERSTTIYLTMTDSNNCVYLDTIHLTVDENTSLHIPTAFTPNGDGSNDHFYLSGENICSGEFSIYNRWGNIVFRTNDIFDHWDGTYEGKVQGLEGFSLVGHVEFCDGVEKVFSTKLHLIR